MKTFILEWRPSISSYKMQDFIGDLEYLEYGDFNWSVWDWEKARSGDNFYLIKCGEDETGIVMKGFFTSDPYSGEDWSGKGRDVHYMDMRPVFMAIPTLERGIITTAELEVAMPDFQWNGGHSGRLLPEEYAARLHTLWGEYMKRFDGEQGDSKTFAISAIPVACIDDAVETAIDAHYDKKDLDGNPFILHPLTVGLAGKNEKEKICGFLHDVIEDSEDWSAGKLREKGFTEDIVDTLLLLTHEKGISYQDYLKRIIDSGDKTALAVKLQDIRHNLQRSRSGNHLYLVEKYKYALRFIKAETGIDPDMF